jgi:DNA-binding GntR family transcriptional regulator
MVYSTRQSALSPQNHAEVAASMTTPSLVEPGPGEPSGAAALYEELRSRIVHLDIAPGTRLTEQALASSFGMSRTPTRRVLDRLAHEGLVTISPRSGATVAAIDYRQLREVWALRLKIAEMVAYFVKLPARPEILERLQRILERLDEVESSTELPHVYDEYLQPTNTNHF